MASIDCSKLTVGLAQAANCAKAEIGGTASRVILLNYYDIDKVTSVVTANVISSLIMSGAAKGFEFSSLPNSTEGSAKIAAGAYITEFDQTVVNRVFVKTEPAKAFLNGLRNARVVAILQTNAIGAAGEVKYEVYGWDSGLKLTDLNYTTAMADKVVADFTLASTDVSKEQSLPKSVFITSLALTETMINSLIV